MSKDNPGVVRRFFRGLGRAINWTRVVVINGVFLILLFIVLAAMFGGGPGPLPERAPLRLEITGFLVDQRSYIDPVAQMFTQGQAGPAETVVRELVRAVNAAAEDPRITELVLDLQYFVGGGISKLEEVGEALANFKESGKQIIATSGVYSQDQYYLASYADQIYMHPMGTVMLTGYGSYRNYFQEALKKLDVNLHVFRVGEYKDAVEPFTRMTMSAESREHNSRWIEQLWNIYTSRVENLRNLPKDAINDYVSNLDAHLRTVNGDASELAINNHLVDHLVTRPELRTLLIERFGYNEREDSYQAIDYQRYLAHLDRKPVLAPDNIGLIVASGTIYDGYQPPGNIGGDTLAGLIREAREVRDVDALVLRVDSGGGSAFASEVIRNELMATKAAGIPVIISMGSVAASGGYWIAANADEIWATPTTLTGSIGVFSILPTFNETLGKLGINTDGYGTNALADAMRLDMPLDPIVSDVMQLNVENIYGRFLTIVAEGRGTEPEAIHPIAQGRVWSGITAEELGLVDQLGYLEDAIASAAARVGADKYRVELIEQTLSPWELFVQGLSTGASTMAKSALSKALLGNESALDGLLPSGRQRGWNGVSELLRLMQIEGSQSSVYAHCVPCVSYQ
ncbi:signal peptide peptidase SppA [Proteobacteria bacterium 005FR1]|nr:signal peptide peptidase SppA [Proteobacteria bacterium 005FR1]